MKRHFTPSRLALALALCSPEVFAQSLTMFDTDILKARGIPVSVASYFQAASRFSPGVNYLNLIVNGKSRGLVSINFNEHGDLCADPSLFRAAGINTKESSSTAITTQDPLQQGTCAAWAPGIDVKLKPGTNSVELLVPSHLIDNDTSHLDYKYVNGGMAAMLNYRLYASGTYSYYNRSYVVYGNTETGFNINNWVVRSYDSYSSFGNKGRLNHQSAWVQRTFPTLKSTIQAGQLTLNSPLFSVPGFNGLQIHPENRLLHVNNHGVSVKGVALSSARVEIRQGGMLIDSTLVPAGPFVLYNVPVNNNSQDLDVSVIEDSGGRNSFFVPAASFESNFAPVKPGWTAAAGQIRQQYQENKNNKSSQGKEFIATTATFPLNHINTNLTTGLLVTKNYTSLGLNAETSFWRGFSTYLRFLAAKDIKAGMQGAYTQAGQSISLGDSLTATFSTTFYSDGFYHLTDSFGNSQSVVKGISSHYNKQKLVYGASLGWNNSVLGLFSVGMTHSKRFNDDVNDALSLTWNRSIGPVNILVNISPRSGDIGVNGKSYENLCYLHVSVPFGSARLSSSVGKDGSYYRTSVNVNQQLTDNFSYNVGSSAINAKHHGVHGGFNLNQRYANLSSNYSYNGYDLHALSASINGSLIYDGAGVLFSPYSVQDTFGIVSIPGLDNVQVQTPSGLVMTDSHGRASIPSVTPYANSSVELVTQNLPSNVEVSNAASSIQAGRGSVSYVKLKASRHRKILFQVARGNGQLFIPGLAVLNNQNNYLSVTGTDSDIYLDIEQTNKGIIIEDENGQRCTLSFTIDHTKTQTDRPYEVVIGTCN